MATKSKANILWHEAFLSLLSYFPLIISDSPLLLLFSFLKRPSSEWADDTFHLWRDDKNLSKRELEAIEYYMPTDIKWKLYLHICKGQLLPNYIEEKLAGNCAF